jgi:hypothetical protein
MRYWGARQVQLGYGTDEPRLTCARGHVRPVMLVSFGHESAREASANSHTDQFSVHGQVVFFAGSCKPYSLRHSTAGRIAQARQTESEEN